MGQRNKLHYFFLIIILSFGNILVAQHLSSEKINRYASEKFKEAVRNLRSFLELPNDGHYPEQIMANLKHCDAIFTDLGFKTRQIATKGAPVLFAEKTFHRRAKTILFYLQIDGQPVDTTQWHQPSPFQPVLKEQSSDAWSIIPWTKMQSDYDPNWRIFARSASDSKGPAMSLISALEIINAKNIKPDFNIKVIMDFQEEMGSPDLAAMVAENQEMLRADMLLIMDGTRHVSNLPTLTYGARGIATATLTVFGARYPLHSGQYGNFAPNPVFDAARLLGGLKDPNGKVVLPGFYDGIRLSYTDKNLLNKVPENKDSILQRLGISQADAVGTTYQEAMQYPSLNIRGLRAGWVGDEVRTIIPDEVTAEIDMRLVPETDGKRLMELLKNHILKEGFHLVDSIPTEDERKLFPKLASFNYRLGSLPFRTDMDSEIGRFLNNAMYKVFGDSIVNMRTTGGSQPMSPFITTLNIPAVSIRIPNPDNNIHSPDENLRLGNFMEGIITCLAILTETIP